MDRACRLAEPHRNLVLHTSHGIPSALARPPSLVAMTSLCILEQKSPIRGM